MERLTDRAMVERLGAYLREGVKELRKQYDSLPPETKKWVDEQDNEARNTRKRT